VAALRRIDPDEVRMQCRGARLEMLQRRAITHNRREMLQKLGRRSSCAAFTSNLQLVDQ
jgi:hypothetical protein